jgi:hypothetical protein
MKTREQEEGTVSLDKVSAEQTSATSSRLPTHPQKVPQAGISPHSNSDC